MLSEEEEAWGRGRIWAEVEQRVRVVVMVVRTANESIMLVFGS